MTTSSSRTSASKSAAEKSAQAASDTSAQIEDAAANGYAMTSAMLHGATTVGQELARFMALRVQHQADVAKALSKCTNPVDAWSACAEAASAMVEDYSREFSRMSDVYAKLGEDVQHEFTGKLNGSQSK